MISIRKLQEKSNAKQVALLRESYKDRFGQDPAKLLPDEAFLDREADGSVTVPMDFSIKALKESLRQNIRKFREANPESAYQGLERYMIQKWTFGGYEKPSVIYPDIFRAVPSKTFQEFYTPLYDTEMPEILKQGNGIPDSKLVGLEVVIKNEEMGRILGLPRILFDRDQTGQIQDKVNRFGMRMREFEELLCMAAMHYIAYSTSLRGGGKNRVAAYGTNLTTLIPEAFKNLRKMKDPLGNFYGQRATHLCVGPSLELESRTVLNSAYFPAVTNQTVTSGGPGVMADNILKGLINLAVSDKLADEDIILAVAKQGGVWQDEYPMEIVQEVPNSGASFSNLETRYRSYRRGNAGIVDVRTFCAINIDSVNVPDILADLQATIAATYTNIGL